MFLLKPRNPLEFRFNSRRYFTIMTEVKKCDDKKPKYDKPVVVDLGEPLTGEGAPACGSGSAAGSGGCNAGGSGAT